MSAPLRTSRESPILSPRESLEFIDIEPEKYQAEPSHKRRSETFRPKLVDIRGRLIKRTRQQQYNAHRRDIPPWIDVWASGGPFWYILQLRWPWLLLIAFLVYTLYNVIFACLYLINESGIRAADGTFWDAFSFSFQTTLTIGYGFLSPKTLYVELLAYLQAFVGLVLNATVAALVYARIFTPTRLRNAIVFSDTSVVNSEAITFDELAGEYCKTQARTISFRFLHARMRNICMPSLRLFLHVRMENVMLPGRYEESLQELPFEMNYQHGRARYMNSPGPFLEFPWLVCHTIDRSSPLYDIDLQTNKFELIPVFDGVDDITGLNFQKYWSYTFDDVEFESVFDESVIDFSHGEFAIVYDRLSWTKPLDPHRWQPRRGSVSVLMPPEEPGGVPTVRRPSKERSRASAVAERVAPKHWKVPPTWYKFWRWNIWSLKGPHGIPQ